jgi:hypothetical protein
MAELYIANVTKQHYHFAYRALERQGAVYQPVPIGGQTRIAPTGRTDLTREEIDYIVDQHRRYGLISVDEVEAVQGSFSGYLYSVGEPVSADKMRRAMLKHEESLDKLGRQIRQEAAVSVVEQVERTLGAPLRTLDMSVEEVEPRGGYAADLSHISEGVRVSRETKSSDGFPMVIPGGKVSR